MTYISTFRLELINIGQKVGLVIVWVFFVVSNMTLLWKTKQGMSMF